MRKLHIFRYILQANKVLIKYYFLCIEIGFSHYDQKLDLFNAVFSQEFKKFGCIFLKSYLQANKWQKKAKIHVFGGFLQFIVVFGH